MTEGKKIHVSSRLAAHITRDIFFPSCNSGGSAYLQNVSHCRAQLSVFSYRRKYPGQSVVCHVRVGRRGIASFQKKGSTTSSNTDGTLDETYACLARAAFF